MSSDEKALKQICWCGHPKERHLDKWTLNYKLTINCTHCSCIEYAHNELLEAQAVNEECEHKKYTLSVSTRNGTRKICNNCGKDYPKEEPTTPEKNPACGITDQMLGITPEKKCCKNCGLDYQDPIYCSIFGRSADKHEWI